MEKTPRIVFPIYFSVVTDGGLPGESNLLHVSAQFEPTLAASWNILPQRAMNTGSARLTPAVLAAIAPGRVPVEQAMRELAKWLERFKGLRVAVTSSVAFWHLTYHMSKVVDKLPFAISPLDVSSFVAGAHGDVKKRSLLRTKEPTDALAARVRAIAEATEHVKEFSW